VQTAVERHTASFLSMTMRQLFNVEFPSTYNLLTTHL